MMSYEPNLHPHYPSLFNPNKYKTFMINRHQYNFYSQHKILNEKSPSKTKRIQLMLPRCTELILFKFSGVAIINKY